MTENKPLWKSAAKGGPYQYADWGRLEKEEPNTILLLKKEEKYTNQDDRHQYWVNYHQKYGWSVARRAIAAKSDEGAEIEATHPEAKVTPGSQGNTIVVEKKTNGNGNQEYWDKRQQYQEVKDLEIKEMHRVNIETQKALIAVLEKIAKALESKKE